MYQSILKKLIAERLINPKGKVSPWLERKISEELSNEVLAVTNFLSFGSLRDRIKTIQLGLTSHLKCCVCGNVTKYHAATQQYADTCSSKCQSMNPSVVELRKQTNLERFGVEHNFQLVSNEQRAISASKGRKKTLERYGVDNPMSIPSAKAKHKSSMSSIEVQNKRITTLAGKSKEYIMPENWKSEYRKYKTAVYHYTRHAGVELLENFDKRGKSGEKDRFHLDHKYSVCNGFMEGIHPAIIGSIENLEFISWEENRKKSAKSSIPLGMLLAMIEMNTNNIKGV